MVCVKKGVGGPRRDAEAEIQAKSTSKIGHGLHLVGLERHGVLGKTRTKRRSQQGALNCLAETCK